MTVLQVAFAAGITAVLTGWCLYRALVTTAPSVASVYRKMYGNPFEIRPTATSRWERPTVALGHALAGTSVAERFAASKRFELRVADVTVTAVATRIVTAALVGFVAAVAATALPVVAGAQVPVWMLVAAPFVIAVATGWYQWPRDRVVKMWLIVVAVSAVSAALGYLLLDPASGRTGSFAQGFAAGALLAMVTDTMLPESYDIERINTGALVAIGFAISLMLSAI